MPFNSGPTSPGVADHEESYVTVMGTDTVAFEETNKQKRTLRLNFPEVPDKQKMLMTM